MSTTINLINSIAVATDTACTTITHTISFYQFNFSLNMLYIVKSIEKYLHALAYAFIVRGANAFAQLSSNVTL